jgi:hypothetical protein
MNDAEMRDAIERNLASEGLVRPHDVLVEVKAGRVHLSGIVPSYVSRCSAVRVARRIAGVQNVFVEVRVLPAAVTDEELANRARAIILWSALGPAERIAVAVSHGVLTLSGSLESTGQHQGLLAQILPLAGIVDLVDRITIGAPASASPLPARIRAALRSHAGADAERIRFEVADDGSVRIEGELSDWRSHHAVVDAVRSLEGVQRVDDAITIDD